MASYALTLSNPSQIAKAFAWLSRAAALGWRVTFAEPKRTDPQNDRMWAMLAIITKAGTINGRKFTADQWKCIFMKQMGKEVEFLPTLDGQSFFPTGFRSSQLSKGEMSDLQAFMEAWAAEAGIDLGAK